MAPTRPAKITPIVRTLCTTTSLAMVLATFVPKKRKAMKLKRGRPHDGEARREDPRRHDGGDGVGGVVEPVDEVEAERDQDHEDERQVLHEVRRA